MAKSSLGQASLSYGIPDLLSQLQGSNFDQETGGHADVSADEDATSVTDGESRRVAAVALMSKEEVEIYKKRIEELKNCAVVNDHANLKFTIQIDAINEIKKADITLYETASYDKNNKKYPKFDASFFDPITDNKTAFVCASLIELLIALKQKIPFYKGGVGTGRKIGGPNHGDVEDNGSLSDHSFGRAFDMSVIQAADGQVINLKTSKSLDNYRKALETLLSALSTISPSLHPDLIVLHPGLQKEYGIDKGFEGDKPKSAIVSKLYPALKKINFYTDSNHTDHIHISFGPLRAGSYQSWLNQGSSTGSTDPNVQVDPNIVRGSTARSDYLDALFESYTGQNQTKGIKNTNALYKGLIEFGIPGQEKNRPQIAAMFMMLAYRETGRDFSPGSLACDDDDFSIGLYQINYSPNRNPHLLKESVTMATRVSGGRINKDRIPMWKLIIKDWQSKGITTAEEVEEIILDLQKRKAATEARAMMDSRLWQPINQLYILRPFIRNYTQFKNGWMFRNWGEYESNATKYGWITKTYFDVAAQFYVENNPGKTKEELKVWARKLKEKNMIIKLGMDNFEKWLDGAYLE